MSMWVRMRGKEGELARSLWILMRAVASQLFIYNRMDVKPNGPVRHFLDAVRVCQSETQAECA
jgi:hypothetical protein